MPSASGPKRSFSPLPRAEQVRLRATAPPPQREATVQEPVVVEPDEPAVARGGDGVAPSEARHRDVGARAGARAAQPRIEHVATVLDHGEPVRVGDLPDAVPVGDVADEVRREDRPGPRSDHLLDAVHIDLVRVRLDVDERGHDPRLHERRDIGGERHHRGDDLVTGRQIEQVDRQAQRRRTRVDHHAVTLGEQLGDPVFEVADTLADSEVGLAQRRDYGVDLAFVMDGARVGQPPPLRPRRHVRAGYASRVIRASSVREGDAPSR